MCFGNKTGFIFNPKINLKELFSPQPGSIILQLHKDVNLNIDARKQYYVKLPERDKVEDVKVVE